jgi:hypothetical protein
MTNCATKARMMTIRTGIAIDRSRPTIPIGSALAT